MLPASYKGLHCHMSPSREFLSLHRQTSNRDSPCMTLTTALAPAPAGVGAEHSQSSGLKRQGLACSPLAFLLPLFSGCSPSTRGIQSCPGTAPPHWHVLGSEERRGGGWQVLVWNHRDNSYHTLFLHIPAPTLWPTGSWTRLRSPRPSAPPWRAQKEP